MRTVVKPSRRWVRVLTGLSIVVLSTGGVWWVVDSTHQLEPYLVTSQEVLPGDEFSTLALEVVYLAVPAGNPGLIAAGERERWGDFVARGSIASGSVLVEGMFGPRPRTNETAFSLQIDIGPAQWLVPGERVDVWVSPPREDQQFSVPTIAAPAARIVSIRANEGFAADPDLLRVDLVVETRDLAPLIHARANGFNIQLSPSVPGQPATEYSR